MFADTCSTQDTGLGMGRVPRLPWCPQGLLVQGGEGMSQKATGLWVSAQRDRALWVAERALRRKDSGTPAAEPDVWEISKCW